MLNERSQDILDLRTVFQFHYTSNGFTAQYSLKPLSLNVTYEIRYLIEIVGVLNLFKLFKQPWNTEHAGNNGEPSAYRQLNYVSIAI